MKILDIINEEWSQKYKNSINCSHPKGFSQKAHCAGKKKHNESIEMEMVCEDCGMCQTHGNVMEIKKGAKDSNGFTKCWPGKHAVGTKKGKNGGQVRNCKPNESQGVAEGSTDLVQIEYWQQETMESGRWVKTKPIPRATAEKIVNSFERGEIVDVEQGVAESTDTMKYVVYRQETTLYQSGERDHNTQAVKSFPTEDKAEHYAKKANDTNPDVDVYYFVRAKKPGVAEGLNDTQKKIEDTINKLEDRLKHAKTNEQWDRISARIERLQAGLKRSKQGVAEEQLEETSPEAIAKINQITRK